MRTLYSKHASGRQHGSQTCQRFQEIQDSCEPGEGVVTSWDGNNVSLKNVSPGDVFWEYFEWAYHVHLLSLKTLETMGIWSPVENSELLEHLLNLKFLNPVILFRRLTPSTSITWKRGDLNPI